MPEHPVLLPTAQLRAIDAFDAEFVPFLALDDDAEREYAIHAYNGTDLDHEEDFDAVSF
jgi:hypothetical protein